MLILSTFFFLLQTRLLCALEGNYLELESNGLGEDTCKLKGHDQHHCLKISCSVPELVGRGFIEVNLPYRSSSFRVFYI